MNGKKFFMIPASQSAEILRAQADICEALGYTSQRPAPEREPVYTDGLVREKDLLKRIAMSRTTLWRRVRAGSFPMPRIIGAHAKAWLESQITAWLEAQPDKSGLREPKQLRRARDRKSLFQKPRKRR